MPKLRTVFASGEAQSADAAYVLADRNLWAQIARISGAEVRSIQHATATRIAGQVGLDIEAWKTERRDISLVLVTLLASITIPTEGPHND